MRKWFFIVPLIFIVISIFQALVSLYPGFLWFDNLGLSSVFWTNFWAKGLTGLVFGLLAFVIAALNIFVALRLTKDHQRQTRKSQPEVNLEKMIREMFGEKVEDEDDSGMVNVTPQAQVKNSISRLALMGLVVFALFMGFSAVTQWQVFLKALNASSFGLADPIFKQDIGFYLFQLPLQIFLQGFVMSVLVLSALVSGFIYFFRGAFSFQGFKLSFSRGVKAHLAAILAVITLVFAWGLWLGSLEILYSARGVVFGAGYTDVKAQLLGYNVQIFSLVILAALLVVNIFQAGYRLPMFGFFAYLAIAVFFGALYPSFVQNFQVKPNEISMESPYIEHAIKYTRLAYGLSDVEEKKVSVNQELTLADLRRNSQTIDNIRLWDTRPLIKTYKQLQEIRTYYDFSDVDVDRYQIDGQYKQVMLSPREMKLADLDQKAQTWVNRHLKFTHGYGACLSPVSKQTSEGLPDLIVKDIPPVTTTDIEIKRPEIYYGEETNDYVIVNTTEKEFDYPKGDKNVYASYQGQGGVRISSLLRRLAFAIEFGDLRILLTEYITPNSRIMFNRSIRQRLAKIAPFLSYDRDPYMVIVQGKLFWIQDAYTTSDLFPYSEPYGQYNNFNYIRNSVKIVVDAYDGSVDFYIVDDQDPIAKTYSKIYPQLFKSFNAMPKELKKHVRYPYDLFMIQASKYATYHMRDPQVYYNREDLWHIPKEVYAGNEQSMDGYYIIMKLPKEKQEEFLLMLPFTPNNKDNMISWLAARSDMPNYGKLIVYKFPKDKLIYGPKQIEARIDQQTEISQQFTLWGQSGSRVIRGNLLAIPIEDSIIYVEPIYLEASNGSLPELKRVIVAYGNNVAMSQTLEGALSSVFSGRVYRSETQKPNQVAQQSFSSKELAKKALQVFKQAQSSLKLGNFADFGDKLDQLKNYLQDLAD